MRYYRPEMKQRAQALRREMTSQERHLGYDYLKGYSYPIKRQKVLCGYILDFYCPAVRLAIELDGSQHYDPVQMAYDERRSRMLATEGVEVLRFTNLQVNEHFPEVCETIDRAIRERLADGQP